MDKKKLLGSIVGCVLVGLLGTPFTTSSIPSWYSQLQKPPFTPPNWIFGPVWTVLYILMGISLATIASEKKSPTRKLLIQLFFVQLALNFLWSVLFFGTRSIGVGLATLIALDVTVYFYTVKAFSFRKSASYLMVPYALWISFATYLNTAIFVLNNR
jgi:tryptophan-rich sensory protein